jgi:hypothetical protein
MRDAIGNKLHEGALLWMQQWGCIAKVTRLHEGGLSVVSGNSREVSPAVITVEIQIPISIEPGKAGQEPLLNGILCVRDPQSERVLESVVKQ